MKTPRRLTVLLLFSAALLSMTAAFSGVKEDDDTLFSISEQGVKDDLPEFEERRLVPLKAILKAIRKYFRLGPQAARSDPVTARAICTILQNAVTAIRGLTPGSKLMTSLIRLLILILWWLDRLLTFLPL